MALAAVHIPIASSGSFLITPNVGLMVWVLVVFLVSFLILRKYVFPIIGAQLDKRAESISGEIDAATQLREEADKVLAEYRERLQEARKQAEEIIDRAHKAGEAHHQQSMAETRHERERALEQIRNDVEAETRRAIDEIRRLDQPQPENAHGRDRRRIRTFTVRGRLRAEAVGRGQGAARAVRRHAEQQP